MNRAFPHERLSPQESAALIDAAKLRARQLRDEARQDFWCAAGRCARAAWAVIRREVARSRVRLNAEV